MGRCTDVQQIKVAQYLALTLALWDNIDKSLAGKEPRIVTGTRIKRPNNLGSN